MKYKNIEIRMLDINPRFTPLRDINFDNLSATKYEKFEVYLNLLRYEEDLNDFKFLIDSFLENKFIRSSSKKILLKKGKDNFYYVVEGNRRTLSISIINKEEEALKAWNELKIDLDVQLQDAAKKNYHDGITSEIKKTIKNWKEIDKKIKATSILITMEDSFFEDLEDLGDAEIKREINSKHAGEERGRRKWSRIKYFYDLKNFFYENKSTFLEKNNNFYLKAGNFFDKNEGRIKTDFLNAIWVTEAISFYNNYIENQVNKQYLKININKSYASPIELVLSQKFKIVRSQEIITLRKIIGYKADIESWTFQTFEINDFQKENLIILLLKNCAEGIITTRKIEDDKLNDEISDILNLTLSGSKSLKTKLRELNNNFDSVESKYDKEKYILLSEINSTKITTMIDNNNKNSVFVNTIISEIETIFPVLSDFSNYFINSSDKSINYPFNHLALFIRNISELVILELFLSKWFNFILKDKKANGILKAIDSESPESLGIYNDKILKWQNKNLGADLIDIEKILILENLDISKTISNFINSYARSSDDNERKLIDSIVQKELGNSVINIGFIEEFQKFFSYFINNRKDEHKWEIVNQFIHKPFFEKSLNNENSSLPLTKILLLKDSFECIINLLSKMEIIKKGK